MASLKKFNGSTWVDSKLCKLDTATDTITTLPTVVYPNATTATVGLKGNTVQNGTPTPASPIQPHGTGDLETVGDKAGQYKIPISSASTTTPVYLGEVETTRKVKKMVFDGTETAWRKGSEFFFNQELIPDYLRARDIITCMCSHYQAYQQVSSGENVPEGYCSLYYSSEVQRFYIKDSNFATLEDFTAYLAAQYAAGTPVTIWYVLATPTTGIVNEPLMKIGDYADTVSGITIPTITGADSFDVLTTLKPSEVSLGYTGWHGVSVKEWDGSQWQ